MRARLVLFAGSLTLATFAVSCGGAAESAEEPAGTEAPTVEAPAAPEAAPPEAEPGAMPAEEAPAAEAPAPRRTPTRPASEPVAEPAPAAEPVAPVRSVPVGTSLILTLDQALSTQVNRAGDPFEAHLTVDLLSEGGEVLLPQGARVRGLVTEAQESPSADTPAVIRLSIVDVAVDGVVLPLSAEVEDVALQTDAKDSNKESAAKVAVGTAAGALLGKVLGGSAKKGAVVGAAAGAAVAIASRDGHATIPLGSRLTVRVLEPLILP